MTIRHLKAAGAALWMLGVFVFFVQASRSLSTPDGIAMAALTILPPIFLWFWFNDPTPTLSESIQEARNAPPLRRPVIRD